jgi:CheY-like chemotaxis protein
MLPVVLSVDDDSVTQMLNKMILSRTGFCEITVPLLNGQEALNWLLDAANKATASTCVILLDLNMPIMNGWEFLDTLQHRLDVFTNLHIIVLSSSTSVQDETKALQTKPVMAYLTKPLTLEMIEQLKQHKILERYFY